MTADNNNKCLAYTNSVGPTVRQRRVSVKYAAGGVTMLGIALATLLLLPFGLKRTEEVESTSAYPQSVLPTAPYHKTRLSTYSSPQAPIPAVSPDGDLDVIGNFVLDGLEFTLAGAGVTNQFGTYREIGNTVSWLGQVLAQPENAPLLASQQPTDASLVALPVPTSTEREMATWLLQNSPWTR